MLFCLKKRPGKQKPRHSRAPGLLLLIIVLSLALAGLSCNAPPMLLSEFNLNGQTQEHLADAQVALPDEAVGDEPLQSMDLLPISANLSDRHCQQHPYPAASLLNIPTADLASDSYGPPTNSDLRSMQSFR